MTWEFSLSDTSISDVTSFISGNLSHTAFIPCGACMHQSFLITMQSKQKGKENKSNSLTATKFRNMILDSATPFFRSREIAFTAEFPDTY